MIEITMISDFRILVDDGKPGKIFVLNSEETSVLSIVDVKDNCLYINQNIFNKHGERVVRYQLKGFGFDIFPYDDSFSGEDIADLRLSEETFWKILYDKTRYYRIDENRIILMDEQNYHVLYYLGNCGDFLIGDSLSRNFPNLEIREVKPYIEKVIEKWY